MLDDLVRGSNEERSSPSSIRCLLDQQLQQIWTKWTKCNVRLTPGERERLVSGPFSFEQDDDVYDRYSHRWTVILLGVFTIAVSAKQFVGDPIECMLPTETGGVHKSYVENYCWIHYTYSIDEGAALTRDFARGANGSQKTPYYIWIPYIFVAAALCTYLPAWLWHVLGHRATFDIPAVINRLAKADLKDAEDRRKNLVALAQHYEKADRYSRSNVRVTDNLFKRAMSTGMFFAGGGPLTGR